MQEIIKEKIIDNSNEETFSFVLECECCKKKLSSGYTAFTKAGLHPSTPEQKTLFASLYNMERDRELVKLVRKATEQYSLCPMCNRIVCDDCFLVCEDFDMCVECAEKLQTQGTIVGKQE